MRKPNRKMLWYAGHFSHSKLGVSDTHRHYLHVCPCISDTYKWI